MPDYILDFDVLIGCNLYQEPELATLTDQSGTKLLRKQIPGIRRIMDSSLEPVKLNTLNVPTEYADQINSLLGKYSDLLTTGYKVPAIKTASLNIRLIDDHIVNRPPTRLAASERAAVREIVENLLDNEIIRESASPYASPVLLVRKKDGTFRMCVDYRELNSHTVKDRYPLPLIDDQLDRLGKGKFFTSLDMASGFHQIPISEDSIEKTAFVTPDGH